MRGAKERELPRPVPQLLRVEPEIAVVQPHLVEFDKGRVGVDCGRHPLLPFRAHTGAKIDAAQRADVEFIESRATFRGQKASDVVAFVWPLFVQVSIICFLVVPHWPLDAPPFGFILPVWRLHK